MNKIVLLALFNICLIGVVLACSSSDDGSDRNMPEPNGPDTSTDSPVETNAPNTDYEAAFEGQTRIGSVSTETDFTTTVFATGLSNPWGMANLPDGRILVTEKSGTMRIVSPSGSVGEPISGIPSVNDAGQGGLLDVAVDPNFVENSMVYWSFSQNGPNGTATAVAKGRLSDDERTIVDGEVIYTAIPEFQSTAHYGSRLAWDGQGNLYVSTGDRSSMVTRAEAQQLDAALGKILRIAVTGEPVAGNPFENQEASLPEIYSYGHRNVQGLAVHPLTGELWASELGPRGGDEINLIQPGNDYGWPTISYGIEYGGSAIGAGLTRQNGMEQPVYYWDPVISPSGMDFYSGSLITEWSNNLFIAALSGQHIVRLVIEDNRVVAEERLLESEGERFRDVLEGADGALYALTDGDRAIIYRLGL